MEHVTQRKYIFLQYDIQVTFSHLTRLIKTSVMDSAKWFGGIKNKVVETVELSNVIIL